jgi:valyl-tRNA synthetase
MPESNLPKTYDFAATEQKLYAWWESNGWFKPRNDPNQAGFDPGQKPFVICIPPPNVTGELHLGHAMFVAVEDLMVRYHRMQGEPTLWVPGSDHAGIATQLQVEKELLRTEEVTREELGREAFVERTWEWKRKYGSIIYDQLRRLGASVDWSRERFTLDEGLSRAVREAFVRLYEKGLIYRGPRLINWSPGLKTAVSDLEVEYSEEPGVLYYFKYPLKGSTDTIPVATTRPETILGDTAVAVHPQDERFRHLVGRTALVPMLDREIPVIADEAVDREFGTGAVKVTPGHDATDYEIGARHNLPTISILDREARVTEAGGPYQGLDRFECRKKLWADIQQAGLTIKTQPYTLNVPRSQRGGEIVEPMISTQWFVAIKPLAEAASSAVRDGRIRIVPQHFEKIYFNWLDPARIKDWCISRQLWWGHRIPVWYCPNGHMTTGRNDPAACGTCGSTELTQDPDVLDTWFSSGLWPFSTLGWPERMPDLAYFYPTTVLETGYDILFFWVARMIMFGLEFTGQAPFSTVYLHGIVRDGEGRKMSKTLGNVIDPRVVMDEFGTDALRFTLLTAGTPGNDLNLSLQRVESNRNFANKIWNITRFVVSNVPGDFTPFTGEAAGLGLHDRWILARLNQTVADVTRLIDGYEFGQAGTLTNEFMWGDFADWYIETAKVALTSGQADAQARTCGVLVYVLDQALRLLHPYVPFVTEAVWGHLPHQPGEAPALIVANWPQQGAVDQEALDRFGHLQDLVRGIRNARADKKQLLAGRINATIVINDDHAWLNNELPVLARLARLETEDVHLAKAYNKKISVCVQVGPTAIYLLSEYLLETVGFMESHFAELLRVMPSKDQIDKQFEELQRVMPSKDFMERQLAELQRVMPSMDLMESQLAQLQRAMPSKDVMESQLAQLQRMMPSRDEFERQFAELRRVMPSKDQIERQFAELRSVMPSKDQIESQFAKLRSVMPSKDQIESQFAELRSVMPSKDFTERQLAELQRMPSRDHLERQLAELQRATAQSRDLIGSQLAELQRATAQSRDLIGSQLAGTQRASAQSKKRLEDTINKIEEIQRRLQSEFVTKAPPAVVEKERERLNRLVEERRSLEAQSANRQ